MPSKMKFRLEDLTPDEEKRMSAVIRWWERHRKIRRGTNRRSESHAAAVAGRVHVNGLENFWCLLKRAIKGTYVQVMPFHLERYVDEQEFRFNSRKGTDATRFLKALANVVHRRLTYRVLTAQGDAGFMGIA